MSLNPNSQQSPTPDAILRIIGADLSAYLAPTSYSVKLSQDAEDALGLLCEESEGGRCIIRWGGDQPFGGAVREGDISVNRIVIALTRSKSLSPDPSDTLSGGDLPFLTALANVRARVLAYRFTSDATEGFLRYAGTSPVSLPDGLPFAAYEISFTLKTAMPVDVRNRIDLAL